MGKKSILSYWGTDPVVDTTAPAYRPQTIEPLSGNQIYEISEEEYASLATTEAVYRVLNQIKILLFVIVIFKLLCLVKK